MNGRAPAAFSKKDVQKLLDSNTAYKRLGISIIIIIQQRE
jgi:hypothetical protein